MLTKNPSIKKIELHLIKLEKYIKKYLLIIQNTNQMASNIEKKLEIRN